MSATSAFATDSQYFVEKSSSLGRASLREEFIFTPTRLKTAFKMALGCSVAMTLGFVLNWDFVYLAMILPVFFNRQDVRLDLRQLNFTAAAAVCIGLLYYLALNFSQDPILFGLILGVRDPLPLFSNDFNMGVNIRLIAPLVDIMFLMRS